MTTGPYRAGIANFQQEETARLLLQAAKPLSLTVPQGNSPAGLAACAGLGWTTDRRTPLPDLLISNIMFYRAPNSAKTMPPGTGNRLVPGSSCPT